MGKIEKLKKFLQENYPNFQAFNSRGVDHTEQVYNDDDIIVDYCSSYGYVEIFGLTDEEFWDLIDDSGFSHLKTFEI